MNKIKLIALDIDETILPQNNIISDRVKKTVEEAQKRGIKVLIATGRMHKSAMPVAKNLNLTSPIISYQGAMIKNFYENEDIIFHCPLRENHAKKIVEILKDDDVQLNIYMDDNLYSQTDTERPGTHRFYSQETEGLFQRRTLPRQIKPCILRNKQ